MAMPPAAQYRRGMMGPTGAHVSFGGDAGQVPMGLEQHDDDTWGLVMNSEAKSWGQRHG